MGVSAPSLHIESTDSMIIWHTTVSIQQKKTVKQGSKNIKMLKDVGMTVPKSRETSVVY